MLNKVSFTLYPAYSRVSIENLVLGHSVLIFRWLFRGIACWLADLSPRLLPWCQSEEIKILKKNHSQNPSVEIEPTTVALQSRPCAPAPRRHQKFCIDLVCSQSLLWNNIITSCTVVKFLDAYDVWMNRCTISSLKAEGRRGAVACDCKRDDCVFDSHSGERVIY